MAQPSGMPIGPVAKAMPVPDSPGLRVQRVLRHGGLANLLSFGILGLANLVLPLTMGPLSYGSYILISAQAWIVLSLIDTPSTIHYITGLSLSQEGDPRGVYFARTVALVVGLSSGTLAALTLRSWSGALAACLYGAGVSALSLTVQDHYRFRRMGKVVLASLIGALMYFVVPAVFARAISPEALVGIAGLIGILAGILMEPSRRRAWMTPGNCGESVSELVAGIVKQGPQSYLKSVVPWVAVAVVASNDPVAGGALKVSLAIINTALAALPLSSSVVLVAIDTADGPSARRRLLTRLWLFAVVFGTVAAFGFATLRSTVLHVFGDAYPMLSGFLPFVPVGLLAAAIYSTFFPVTRSVRAAKHGRRLLAALAVVTVLLILVVSVDSKWVLGLYVLALALAAIAVTIQAGLPWPYVWLLLLALTATGFGSRWV